MTLNNNELDELLLLKDLTNVVNEYNEKLTKKRQLSIADSNIITSINPMLANKVSTIAIYQINLLKEGKSPFNSKLLDLLDMSLDLYINAYSNNTIVITDNNSLNPTPLTTFNVTLSDLINSVNEFSYLVLKENKGKNMLIISELLSIQSSSISGHNSPVSNAVLKMQADSEALKNRVSTIDFTDCENFLKNNGILRPKEAMLFSKIDWNPKIYDYSKAYEFNITKSNGVSYSLYAENLTKLELNLCENLFTSVNIPLRDFHLFNTSNLTYNPFDINSPFFTDICLPNTMIDQFYSFSQRRNQFLNFTLSCSGTCLSSSIDNTKGYLNCKCRIKNSKDITTPLMSKLSLNSYDMPNVLIIQCYNLLSILVRILINFK
jgi:hypothetical protein